MFSQSGELLEYTIIMQIVIAAGSTVCESQPHAKNCA